jgi:two-component sensor histidine kinase
MTKRDSTGSPAEIIEKLRRHMRIVVDLGRIVARNGDVEHFFHQAVVQVARAIEIDHVKILRYRPDTADLLIVAGIGWKPGVVGNATFPSDLSSPPGRSYQTAEPVVLADLAKAKSFVISDILKEHGIAALANVPVMIDGAVWGVLEIDSSTERDFSTDTTDFMTAAAAIIGTALRRQAADDSKAAALVATTAAAQAREVLLREMQHRVKNNFQLVLASIASQKRRFDNREVDRAMTHVANRISAISLAHDQLSPAQDHSAVDLAGYLRALCASIEQQTDTVVIDVTLDEVELAIERAVPLGLIVNEAITNSIKHAFGEDGRGRISVTLTTGVGYGEAKLVVADDGSGMKTTVSEGSGLRLINSLARQIGAEVARDSSREGTRITVVFPVIT